MKEHDIHSSLIRKPVFAGSFYPASKKHLLKQLETFFSKAKAPVLEKLPQAIIAPHAGYVFSGSIAASAYNQLTPGAAFERVFILASSHRCTFQGASVSNAHYYETPLGKIEVDVKVAGKLHGLSSLLQYRAEAHQQEHSLEVQLPFLQYKLGNDFRLVPVVFGTHDAHICEQIAHLLEPWFTPENLFVVSTDFSHYPAYNDAVENDFNTAQALCSNNPEALLKIVHLGKPIRNLATSLCGWTSVVTLLYLTQFKSMKFIPVQYGNSGDAPGFGERERVVGYWAIAAYYDEKNLPVSKQQQVEMLEKARQAILLFLLSGRKIQPAPSLQRGGTSDGMFVSVYVRGELRGCIGNINGGYSMNETLEQLAVSASCDKRFESLAPEDFEDMELEISILSPLRKIKTIDEIVPGKHGVYIQKGTKSGTFLPKVAEKTGWTVEELLAHCAHDKAGLGWNDWKDANIYIYEAYVFRG